MPKRRNNGLSDLAELVSGLKLRISPIPRVLHGRNLRLALGQERWRAFRRGVLSNRGPLCEICGAFPQTASDCHVHEEFEYNLTGEPAIATLRRIGVVCRKCHAVEHFMRTCSVRSAGTMSKTEFEEVINHFYRVNGIARSDAPTLIEECATLAKEIEATRCKRRWRVDFGKFAELLTRDEIMGMQPANDHLSPDANAFWDDYARKATGAR